MEDANLKQPLMVQYGSTPELAGLLPGALTLWVHGDFTRVEKFSISARHSTVLGPAIAPSASVPLLLCATLLHFIAHERCA